MIANILVTLGLVLAEAGAPRPGRAPAATAPASLSDAAIAPSVGTPAGEDASLAAARTAAQGALADGNRHLKDGDVAGAIADYRRAQAIYPPAAGKIEFNIAKAEETRGDEPAAAAAFERFLSQALEIPPEYREEARNELRRLSAALGSLRLAERRPGYDVIVDGREHGKTPLDRDLWVRPGHHVITLEQDHRVLFRDDVEVESGGTVQVTVTIRHTDGTTNTSRTTTPPSIALATPPASATTSPPTLVAQVPPVNDRAEDGASPPIWKRWWFWTAAGALVAGGVVVLILATRDNCPRGVICQPVNIPPAQ